MLKELRCNKLATGKLEFEAGLNALVGPEDGANSIGKSSVLMLIDFALAGDDFISLCSDVMDNVGAITIEMDFIFGGEKYCFARSTNDPKIVVFLSEDEKPEKSVDEYRSFLKKNYIFPEEGASFRGAVNPFFRIWGKENDNPNKPLNSFPSEPYQKIKPNLLKLFSFYGVLKSLEKEKTATSKKKSILKGAFDEGYIKSLTKREKEKSEKRIEEVESEINEIKKVIEAHSINANKIISKENFKIKAEKDALVRSLFQLKSRQKRIETNLTYGSAVNKKHFDKLEEYFPEVNSGRLTKVEQFHSGVSKILKAELRYEKQILDDQVKELEFEISEADKRLLESTGMIEKPSGLVDKMLDLSFEERSLRDQIRFRDIKSSIDTEVVTISEKITEKTTQSLASIESKLNSKMAEYISIFYEGKPVTPQIKLSETRYEFKHNEDSGTGKAYANMVALDMSILEETYLPILIHDLIVFSNIEDHAIEAILEEYSVANKQVFIALDKLGRFKNEIQKLVKEKEFLALDSKTLAFGQSWKKRT
ncbi:DUF2326 domain-containing protein [uncultured Shewanella sp.]|uniref:DUF2326 domain-containing protein n=1 Tax=uncultured Shewanella sp. TaxID=173975 RepID=UPI00262C05DF|nr:DUF2326 domain-containing protein [uncultured Shewanella sp.]